MSKKGGPMRVSAQTKRAINMLAAELQLKTGDTVSADEALWDFIKKNRPDIASRAETSDSAEEDADDEEKPRSKIRLIG